MVGVRGLEPRTPSTPYWCATNCATPRRLMSLPFDGGKIHAYAGFLISLGMTRVGVSARSDLVRDLICRMIENRGGVIFQR